MNVSRVSGISYFDLLDKYTDEVIPLVNYLIESAAEKESAPTAQPNERKGKQNKDIFWDYV